MGLEALNGTNSLGQVHTTSLPVSPRLENTRGFTGSLLRADHTPPAPFQDGGFLTGDVGQRLAQQVGVFQPDACEHHRAGPDHIGGIEPAAQAGLDNRPVHPGLASGQKEKGREVFKYGFKMVFERIAGCRAGGGDAAQQRTEALAGQRPPFDPNAFPILANMGGSIERSALTTRTQQRLEHQGRGTFSARAGEVNCAQAVVWVA